MLAKAWVGRGRELHDLNLEIASLEKLTLKSELFKIIKSVLYAGLKIPPKKNQLKVLFLTYFLNALCIWNVLCLNYPSFLYYEISVH